MSFDKETRNSLSKMVAACRRLLTEDVTDQLRGRFGMHPDGTILPVDRLDLAVDQMTAAESLRELLDHFAAGEAGRAEERWRRAYDRLVLEISFTVLNRLAALRLCEERGLVVECVRQGTASGGFRLFERVAGGALGTRYQTYRVFIDGLFDELAEDLGVLFDLSTPQSAVFPSERCLDDVLAELNKTQLAPLWAADETIGWIYQYFNPPEERKAMRDASQTPRNSRELAVRNQFFTPRYVVEFLTDNTLGRIWYEMRRGETALADDCRYLVRRPTEIFLGPGEEAPPAAVTDAELAQEDLLKQAVHIEHRPKKDPRDLRVLDPACGSGHFLLYAFDLLERVYDEAWHDPESPKSEATGRCLREEKGLQTVEDLRRAAPKLIIEHNLHGIDIDPRAVQIAALALWLRAQKAWKALGLKAIDRPRIERSHIVTAEPMPGEEDMRREFTAGLRPRVLGQLVDAGFKKMKLAGEAGALLKIEEEIKDAITAAKAEFVDEQRRRRDEAGYLPGMAPPREATLFDFTDLSERDFWAKAEDLILASLQDYAMQVEHGHALRRRLFAEDAARGFAFIDLCRKRYDVVLMNPPFGETPLSLKPMLSAQYVKDTLDIFDLFYRRAFELAHPTGTVGAITPRTMLYQGRFAELREYFTEGNLSIDVVGELDLGVLDAATVRPALFAISKGRPYPYNVLYIDLLHAAEPHEVLLTGVTEFCQGRILQGETFHSIARFASFPDCRFSFWAGPSVLDLFDGSRDLEPHFGKVTQGLSCDDDNRFLRCWWEVPSEKTTWKTFGKFDARSTFVADFSMLIDWSPNTYALLGTLSNRRANEDLYYKPGIAFTRSCEVGMAATVLPGDIVFSTVSRYFLLSEKPIFGILAYLNTRLVEGLHLVLTPDRDRVSGTLRRIPVFVTDESLAQLESDARVIWQKKNVLVQTDETQRNVVGASVLYREFQNLSDLDTIAAELRREVQVIESRIETNVAQQCPATDADLRVLYDRVKPREGDNDLVTWAKEITTAKAAAINSLSETLGFVFGRWDIRYATGERATPELPDPFAPLPVCPPGMLQGDDGLPLSPFAGRRLRAEDRYPIDVAWEGILVDDADFNGSQPHHDDIVRRVRGVLDLLWNDRAHKIEREACELLGVKELRDYFRRPGGFFQGHLKRYSKSRRKAPIYWPLSTASGSYTLWLYYHRLTDQTLYAAVNKYVEPKFTEVEHAAAHIEKELDTASSRDASRLRDLLNEARAFAGELRELREELLRIAALPYRPNLNDGVIINAAPFHKLFRLRPWAKETEQVWKKLEKGDYDWAHLAYTIWPERVKETCRNDRSIAIAHGLEDMCESEMPTAKGRGKGIGRKKKEVEG